MAIIAKATGGNFVPAPPGTHPAVCVDVVDLGMLEVSFAGKTKTQHKIRIVWQIDEVMADDRPYTVRKRYTLSLHEKAQLRKDLESWRGRQFSPEELEGFDVETVIGVGCIVNVLQEKKDGQTYSNVASIMRLPKGMQAPTQRDYIRVCDRQPQNGNAPPIDDESFNGITDEDVPF